MDSLHTAMSNGVSQTCQKDNNESQEPVNVTGLLAADDGWSLWCRHFLFLWAQSCRWKSCGVFSDQGRTIGQRKKEFLWPDSLLCRGWALMALTPLISLTDSHKEGDSRYLWASAPAPDSLLNSTNSTFTYIFKKHTLYLIITVKSHDVHRQTLLD